MMNEIFAPDGYSVTQCTEGFFWSSPVYGSSRYMFSSADAAAGDAWDHMFEQEGILEYGHRTAIGAVLIIWGSIILAMMAAALIIAGVE